MLEEITVKRTEYGEAIPHTIRIKLKEWIQRKPDIQRIVRPEMLFVAETEKAILLRSEDGQIWIPKSAMLISKEVA